MSRKLYVGNLPYETNESDLQALFAAAGDVESVNVIRDRETGRARGFAFVEMASDEGARQAVTQLNEREFGGREQRLQIRFIRFVRKVSDVQLSTHHSLHAP